MTQGRCLRCASVGLWRRRRPLAGGAGPQRPDPWREDGSAWEPGSKTESVRGRGDRIRGGGASAGVAAHEPWKEVAVAPMAIARSRERGNKRKREQQVPAAVGELALDNGSGFGLRGVARGVGAVMCEESEEARGKGSWGGGEWRMASALTSRGARKAERP